MKLKRAMGFILMIMVVMLYGCGGGGENKGTKITSVNLETTGVIVKIDSVVELPKFAVASWNDGSETSVGIIWDKTTVDTSKIEKYTFTGTVTGWDGKLVYNVEVVDVIDDYSIGAYLISNTATVEPGASFTLPGKAMVKWSIGTETEAEIIWDKVATTSKEGTYTFKGTVEGYTLTYTLIVKKGITSKITKLYLPVSSNTVRQNNVFTLPTQGKAVWSNGEITDIALTWDNVADTSKLGTVIYTATGNGTTLTAQYALTVIELGIVVPKILTLDLETVTVDVDSTYELPTSGKVTMSDGVEKIVELKWNKTTVDTSSEGTYIYVASYTENKVTVTKVMTLIVGGEVKIEKLTLPSNEVTIPAGTKYTLPVTATAVYTDGTEAEVVLTWDKKADTSKEGTYTFTGTAKETIQTVILTLKVGPKVVTITGLSITPNKATVLPGATFTLPAKGTAVLSDGTEKEVALTWDKEVDTSEEGTYTFIGKTSGSILEVKYTLVVDADAVPELQSLTITPATATVAVNGTYTLPAKGTAVYTDLTTKEVVLTWNKKVDTSKEGTTVYTASYTENSKTVKAIFTLTVTGDKTVTGFTISKVDDITGIGTVYKLPETGTITYEDETTEEVTVTWDKSVNTTTAGKYTFIGTNATAGDLTVTFVLTVTTLDTPVLTMSDISDVKAGDTIEVAVNASFFTKTVKAIDVRLNYDTTILKGLDDVTMVVSGMKIVKHIGTEQDVSVVLDKPTVISGTLFKVKFKVLKDGKTSIKFANGTEFLGSDAKKIEMDTTDTGEVGTGIITEDNSTLTLSDWKGTTNDTAEVTVKAEGFKETSLGFDIILNYDTKYLTALEDVTLINSDLWKDFLIVTEPSAGKIKISVTTTKVSPIVLSGDLFKVKFKSTGVVTTGTPVSFGEVRVANSTDGYQNSITTIDTANVVVTQGEIITTKGTFEIGDAKGTYPGYATVVLSGKDFTETASGVEFTLNYDSNYLEVENVSTDVMLTGVLASGRMIPVVTAGKLKIAIEIDNKTFTANGDLVTIKFKTKKAGESALSFANVDLGNAAASGKIEATTTDTAKVTVELVVAKATSVELTASSTSIEPKGSTTLTAVVKDENGKVMSEVAADIYNGTTKVGSSTYSFTSTTLGTYTFTAKSGTLTSTAVTVTVENVPERIYFEYGPYKVNPSSKVGVYKTGMEVLKPKQMSGAIAGNASYTDWTEDMLIVQGAGFDDCKSFRGHHETASFDPYTLYATWDDTNLYIGLQYVYLNDIFDPSNMKGDSSWPTWTQGTMILAFDTNSNWSTGLTTAGTNPWGDIKGFTLTKSMGVDTLFYFSSNPAAVNSAVYLADDKNLMVRKKKDVVVGVPYKTEMEDLGIVYGACNGSFAKNIWGYGGNGIAGLETMSNFKDCASHDRKGLDIFYEMKIPFTALGITKDQLVNNGIGVMYMATNGQSPIDSLPHDPATVDNAVKPFSQDESTSAEKEDCDNFTTGLARIGKK